MRRAYKNLGVALLLWLPLPARSAQARNVYLNGVDISAALSQTMKSVDVHIDEAGNIFIAAPQYHVKEEETYLPLSRNNTPLQPPVHQKPQALQPARKEPSKDGNMDEPTTPATPTPAATSPVPPAPPPAQPLANPTGSATTSP
jgi:hypothetical protein